MPPSSKKISLVIPAYNEENRLPATLEKIIAYMNGKWNYEIIVVDDGSADRTVEVARQFSQKASLRCLSNGKNEGKGSAVRKGVMDAQGDLIFFTDADLSTPIEEIDRFLVEIEQADIVIGSREAQGAHILNHEPFYRHWLGRIFCYLVNFWCVPGFRDTQCGAKMFKRDAAKALFPKLKIARFAFDVEILYLARLMNYKVKEMPIDWYWSRDTRVRTFSDGFKMLMDLIKIRFLHKK